MLNGVSGRQFACLAGVRQGDPFFPLIFVLAADLLQAAVNDAFRQQKIQLPIPARGSTDYPVIQYTDDTILLMPACPQQVKNMKLLLTDYAESIGLKLNFSKSLLIPINGRGLSNPPCSALAMQHWHYAFYLSRLAHGDYEALHG